VDGLGKNNLIEVIIVALMRCGGLTREDVSKKMLSFGANGTFIFQEGKNKCYKGNQRCLGTLFNGCSL
jgi:hypothetical protein